MIHFHQCLSGVISACHHTSHITFVLQIHSILLRCRAVGLFETLSPACVMASIYVLLVFWIHHTALRQALLVRLGFLAETSKQTLGVIAICRDNRHKESNNQTTAGDFRYFIHH